MNRLFKLLQLRLEILSSRYVGVARARVSRIPVSLWHFGIAPHIVQHMTELGNTEQIKVKEAFPCRRGRTDSLCGNHSMWILSAPESKVM